MTNPVFDMNKFNEAYQAALHEAGAEHKKLGIDIGTVTGQFCANWPKIMGFFNTAIGLLGWWQPSVAVMAKAAITAINQVVVPSICGTSAPVPGPVINHGGEK